MIKKILELKENGKSNSEIGKELEMTHQKVAATIKRYEINEANKPQVDEFPASMFAKSSKIVSEVDGIIVMTAREYNEFSEANGRYQGRKEGVVTKLNPQELRIAITGIQRGDRSANDVREHLKNKHGIDDDGIRRAAMALTKEEEISYAEVVKSIGLRP